MNPQQQAAEKAGEFVGKLNDIILFPTIALLMAIAFLVFIIGCFEYFRNAASAEGRQKGIKHITFGIIGLVVMVSALAILTIVAETFILGKQLDCANNPTAGGCDKVFGIPDSEDATETQP